MLWLWRLMAGLVRLIGGRPVNAKKAPGMQSGAPAPTPLAPAQRPRAKGLPVRRFVPGPGEPTPPASKGERRGSTLILLGRMEACAYDGAQLPNGPEGDIVGASAFDVDNALPMETASEAAMRELITRHLGLGVPTGCTVGTLLFEALVAIFVCLGADNAIAHRAAGLIFGAACCAWAGPDDEATLRLERRMRQMAGDPLFTLHRAVEWVCSELGISYFPSEEGTASQLHLASGERVVNRYRSQLGDGGVEGWLRLALGQIKAAGRQFIEQEVNLLPLVGEEIGRTICVPTGESDRIVFAARPGKTGVTRFVFGRQAEPTSWLTVVLKKAEEDGTYVLITAFFGRKPEPEPWDDRATQNSHEFWRKHALVWGSTSVNESTLADVCPWEVG